MKTGLPSNHNLPTFVTQSVALVPVGDGQPLLTDVQYEAIDAGVARGESILVSAPTSTGKTLIGWWAVAAALQAGKRAVYLVSHRALAKQKFEEAQRLFLDSVLDGDRAGIVCATGDGVEDASGKKTNAPLSASLLIATYEKFLGCLSVGGPPRDLTGTTFICDEVQLIGDKSRGRNVELLLTLLRRSGWSQLVGLSAVLSEADSRSLSDWLGLTLIRNPTREKALRIECRTPAGYFAITAAPGSVSDIEDHPERRSVDTDQIIASLVAQADRAPVIAFCMKVDDTYTACSRWTAHKQPVLQVVPPPGLDVDPALLTALTKRAAYHNAELTEEERLFVEDRVASGHVDVVFATSTLAAGVNFPLGSAVFTDWRRWNFDRKQYEPIGRAEFQNMAGRVGRMGQAASQGLVILSASSSPLSAQARQLVDLTSQDELGLGIRPRDFGSLILQLFAGRLCSTREEAFELIASTLSANREAALRDGTVDHWRPELTNQIDRLVQTGCLIEGRSKVSATAFGLSVAHSGLKPETVLYFVEGLIDRSIALTEMLSTPDQPDKENDLLFVLAHAALTSPEFNSEGGPETRSINWRIGKPGLVSNDYARRLDGLLLERPWQADPSAANGALLLAGWAAGEARNQLSARVPGVRGGGVEATARDAAWILTGIAEVIFEATSPVLADESKPVALRGNSPQTIAVRQLARSIRRQAARIAAGVPGDCLWLMNLELRGSARRRLSRLQMLALRFQGMLRPMDLMDGSPEADGRRRLALTGAEGPALANIVRDAARMWKQEERHHFRRVHMKRGEKLGVEGMIAALYDDRGDALEVAFAKAMSAVAIQCQPLDEKHLQAHPDFLLTIEEFPSLVVEVKSKVADTALISLNAASEVLTASELIGLAGNFCVTLCSPGVEPNVPGVIERCGRLSVVSTSDLAEAVLRLLEGSLTRAGFYNWLTTPGVALREDLPHPL